MADRFVAAGSVFTVVHSTHGNFDLASSTIALDGGGFEVVWRGRSSISGFALTTINGAHFDDSGAKIGNTLQITSYQTDNLYSFPDAAPLPGGGFVVGWDNYSGGRVINGTFVGNEEAYAAVVDASGHRLRNPVSNDDIDNQRSTNVAGLSNGSSVLSWSDFGQFLSSGSTRADAKLQVIDATGRKTGGEQFVSPSDIGYQANGVVEGLAGGGFVAVWRDGHPQLSGQIFDNAGNKVGGVFGVGMSSGDFSALQVTPLTSGQFLVSWEQDNGAGFAHSLVAARFDAGGNRLGDPIVLDPQVYQGMSRDHFVSPLGDGFVVVSNDATGFLADTLQIQAYDANGVKRGQELILTTDDLHPRFADFNQAYAQVAGLGSDSIVLTWYDPSGGSFDTDGAGSDVRAQIFKLLPNVPPQAVDDSAGTLKDVPLTLAQATLVSNDVSGDGDTLTIASVGNALHGKVALDAAANVVFTPDAGFVGTAFFDYTVSDGSGGTDIGTVAVTVTASVALGEGDDSYTAPTDAGYIIHGGGGNDRLTGAGGQDVIDGGTGNDVIEGKGGDDTLTGGAGADTFLFDTASLTGRDLITDLGPTDVIATTRPLTDGNHDGIITFGQNHLLDLSGGQVDITGIDALRYLGTSGGRYYYADAETRPGGHVIEDLIGNESLIGSTGTVRHDVFFVDSALGLPLGKDTIHNFGMGDILVTTTIIPDGNGDRIIGFGGNGTIDIANGAATRIVDDNGRAVTQLEFDGGVSAGDVHYYVYSLVGSAAGLGQLLVV